jgi:maltose-binding protein MalE
MKRILQRFLLMTVIALLCVACAGQPTTAPTSTVAPPAPTPAPAGAAAGPTIKVQPAAGGRQTQITVIAAGFPADAHVSVYLAGPDGQREAGAFGEAMTGPEGRVGILFVLPDARSDGSPMPAGTLSISVATDDEAQIASAEFTYQP